MQDENKTLTWVAIGIILVVVIAVAGALILAKNNAPTTTTNNTTTTTTTDTTDTTTPASRTFTLNEQNSSGQNGTVLLEEVGTQTRVTISLSNPTSTVEPAHIHTGVCPTPGAVVYPLTNVVDGSSVTMIDATLASLEAQVPLAVNIHKSTNESGTYYACGDLAF